MRMACCCQPIACEAPADMARRRFGRYVVETTNEDKVLFPDDGITKGDLLIICSRTGGSKVLEYYVRIARKARARVAVVTARPDSVVAQRADVVLGIDDKLPKRGRTNDRPLPPLGSLFEQALLVVLDQVVLDLMQVLDLTEADMARIHTGFE